VLRGFGVSLPHSSREGSPFEAVTLGAPYRPPPFVLRDLPNRPHEAGQLTRDGDSGLGGSFASSGQAPELSVESGVCSAGDSQDGFWLPVSPPADGGAGSRPVTVMPCGFHQDSPQVGITSSRDRPLAALRTAAVLAGNQSRGAHELRRLGVSPQVSRLRQDRQGRRRSNTAQHLEPIHLRRMLRPLGGLLDVPIEPPDLL